MGLLALSQRVVCRKITGLARGARWCYLIAGILAVLWKRVDLQRATRAAYSLIYGQSACLLVSYRPLVIIEGILSFRLILRYLRAERTRGTGNSLPAFTGRQVTSGAEID